MFQTYIFFFGTKVAKTGYFDDSDGLLILFPIQDDFIVWRSKKKKRMFIHDN